MTRALARIALHKPLRTAPAAWPMRQRSAISRQMPTVTDLRPPDDATIIIRRVIDAPRELVFEAFTDPEHLPHFWGPQGFTCPSCEVDLRVGGAFNLQMRGPDGVDYPCSGTYREIVPPE